jgi:hypothetical protein
MNPLSVSVCVTVDVEDFFLPRPPGFDTVFASIDGVEHGIGRIMELLEAHSAKGTFFVDVFNRETLDAQLLARACGTIVERGHEVGLHTHPAFPRGKRGYGMQQVMSRHDFQTQRDFIARGIELLERWCGVVPRVHRAGGYGANPDTLRALRDCGLFIDSSLLYGYPGCELNSSLSTRNRMIEVDGVIEVPVSVTRNRFSIRLPGLEFTPFSMIQKVDLDWLDGPELRQQISALYLGRVSPIILFMHSYSLLDVRRGFRPYRENQDKLEGLLEFAGTLPGTSMDTLSVAVEREVASPGWDSSTDPLPEIKFSVDDDVIRWLRWARHTVHFGHFQHVARTLWRNASG